MRYVRSFTRLLGLIALPLATLHAQGDPPSRVARLSALIGQVSFQPSGATDWSDATINYTVTTGDRLYTAPGSRAELEVGSMSLRLSENADVTVTDLSDHFMQVGLAQGTIRLTVYRTFSGDSVEIDTPNGAVVVTTPGEYRIEVPASEQFSVVSVDAGNLEITAPGVDQELRGGQAVQLSGTDNVRIVSIPRPPQVAFDLWSSDRDRRDNASPCSRYMSHDIPGCADLDDAGRWETVPQYGPVWYPARVAVDWVPYREGRWVWIEPWGWSWVEAEPWGYAPFHYGRWAHIGPRWGWVPGPVEVRPYYAPALVVFAGGPGVFASVSIGAQAWFPLGPREAFIPSYHHSDGYLRQVNVTNVRNVTNVTTFVSVERVDRVQYVNRSAGYTVVSGETFRSGRPIAHEVIKVRPEEVLRAPIISHPNAAPVERAALGGMPVARPPIAARPVMVVRPELRREPDKAPPARGGPPPARGGMQRANNPPPVLKQTPPPVVTKQAPPVVKPVPPPDQTRGGRTLITRTTPPPQNLPFKAKEPVLQEHPGKPLEPQQLQNMRAGKPAGPPKDPEFPPHKVEPARGGAPPAKPPAKEPPKGGKADSSGRGRGRQ